jgi:hypothetical protein
MTRNHQGLKIGEVIWPEQGPAPQKEAARPAADESNPFWRLLRGPSRARDQILTPLAVDWADALPEGLKPLALCEGYPRVANRLALCWADPALTDLVLREMLNDKRRRRKGFPDAVRLELLNLHAASIELANPG